MCKTQQSKPPAVMGLQNSRKQENWVLFQLEKETLNTRNASQSMPASCLAIFIDHEQVQVWGGALAVAGDARAAPHPQAQCPEQHSVLCLQEREPWVGWGVPRPGASHPCPYSASCSRPVPRLLLTHREDKPRHQPGPAPKLSCRRRSTLSSLLQHWFESSSSMSSQRTWG